MSMLHVCTSEETAAFCDRRSLRNLTRVEGVEAGHSCEGDAGYERKLVAAVDLKRRELLGVYGSRDGWSARLESELATDSQPSRCAFFVTSSVGLVAIAPVDDASRSPAEDALTFANSPVSGGAANVVAEVKSVPGQCLPVVFFYTRKHVPACTELTIDYNASEETESFDLADGGVPALHAREDTNGMLVSQALDQLLRAR